MCACFPARTHCCASLLGFLCAWATPLFLILSGVFRQAWQQHAALSFSRKNLLSHLKRLYIGHGVADMECTAAGCITLSRSLLSLTSMAAWNLISSTPTPPCEHGSHHTCDKNRSHVKTKGNTVFCTWTSQGGALHERRRRAGLLGTCTLGGFPDVLLPLFALPM